MKWHDKVLVYGIFKGAYSRGRNLKEDNNIKFGYTVSSNIFKDCSETFIFNVRLYNYHKITTHRADS